MVKWRPSLKLQNKKARKVIQLYINSKVHDALNVQLSLVSIGLELYQLIGQELGGKNKGKKEKLNRIQSGGGCGSVGRAVTSVTRDLQFESSYR